MCKQEKLLASIVDQLQIIVSLQKPYHIIIVQFINQKF